MGFTYAPEASVVSVFLIIGAFLTILGWFTRRSFYNKIKEHVVQAAVNEWSSMRGGGAESVHVRALCEFYYMRLKSDAGTAPVKEKKGKKGGKLSPVNSAADLGQEITEDPALQAKVSKPVQEKRANTPSKHADQNALRAARGVFACVISLSPPLCGLCSHACT